MTKISLTAGQGSGNNISKGFGKYRKINFVVAQKIIYRFLSCDRLEAIEVKRLRYTREELTEKLGITLEEFEKIKAPYFYNKIAAKITMPLASLYCSTKWANEKCEDGK